MTLQIIGEVPDTGDLLIRMSKNEYAMLLGHPEWQTAWSVKSSMGVVLDLAKRYKRFQIFKYDGTDELKKMGQRLAELGLEICQMQSEFVEKIKESEKKPDEPSPTAADTSGKNGENAS